jgi:hypothetical protein
LTYTRLAVANAQSNVNIAANKAMQQKLQEYRLLLDIGKSGGDTSHLEPSVAALDVNIMYQ